MKKDPKLIQVTGGNLELRKVSPMADNSVNLIINIGEQEDEVLGVLYGMKKRGLEYLLLSDENIEGDISDDVDEDFSIH